MKNIYRWDNLNHPELKALSEQEAIVIIPTGSTEQHGLHLPVGTDQMIATFHAEEVAKRLTVEYGKPAIVSPAVSIGNSYHHMSFPGTITLEPDTYIAFMLEYLKCVAAHGFRKIFILNGHGGNVAPTTSALIKINEALGFPVFFGGAGVGNEKTAAEILETQTSGIHACESETSVALYLMPDLVDPCYKDIKTGDVTKDKPFSFGLVMQRLEHYTPIGSIGNTYAATAEKGKLLFESNCASLAKILSEQW